MPLISVSYSVHVLFTLIRLDCGISLSALLHYFGSLAYILRSGINMGFLAGLMSLALDTVCTRKHYRNKCCAVNLMLHLPMSFLLSLSCCPILLLNNVEQLSCLLPFSLNILFFFLTNYVESQMPSGQNVGLVLFL